MGQKQQVLISLFNHCRNTNNYVFDNELVKDFCKNKFKNPFDVTKIDSSIKLPKEIKDADYFLVHLGKGRHKFIKGIKKGYHNFEKIKDEDIIDWNYKRSLLNEYDTSESNILSVVFNQRIVYDFLYDDISVNPKIYNSKRTKGNFEYKIGDELIKTNKLQIEIDMTVEHQGNVTVFEAKNGFGDDFSIYQIYLPCLYYKNLNQINNIGIKNISSCYLTREKYPTGSIIRMYKYVFNEIDKIDSIKLEKSKQYNLGFKN